MRTSAHTGVAIRIPLGTMLVDQLPTKDCHVARVLLAMTSKDRRHYRYLGTAARRAHGSSAEHAMRDLIASHAPLRTRRHKARPVSTKTLTPGDSRGSQSPWHAFLLYLSPCSERWSPRRAFRKENASKNVQRKMESPKGVGCRKRPVKS